MVVRSIILLASTLCITRSSGQSRTDVLHYKFELNLSDTSDTIHAKTLITVRFNDPADEFWLNLAAANSNGKGMTVTMARDGNDSLSLMQQDDTLIIHLKRPVQKLETRTFEISYKGIPSDGLVISRNIYGDRTFFADNWPNRAHDWIPCKDEPDDKATFEFVVTAPTSYQVISNGRLQEETSLPGDKKQTHWTEDIALSTKVMVIGVAKFATKQFMDSPANVPVSAWVYPQDSARGFRNYSPAPGILKFFSAYIGPYPYNKLANVQSKTIFGGMENASAIFYYEESAEENKSIEDLMAHEIAHQWFGDMVSEKNFSHLWLSEGFATYLADVYLESRYGTDSMNRRLAAERKDVINFVKESSRPVVDSITPARSLLNPNSYQKGAWVLHMLRKQMGDSLFQRVIRNYYQQFKGKNATTEDFRRVAEEVTGKDLKKFFMQWLYTPGIPQLSIRWQPNLRAKSAVVTVTQQQKQGVFEFPLEIRIHLADGKTSSQTLRISKPTEAFILTESESIVSVSADPGTALLFDGKAEKIN